MASVYALIGDLIDPRPRATATQESVFAQLGYSPTAKQWIFHRATEFDVLYGGAAGGGKSKAIVMHALWACVAFRGIRVGIFRRTYDELEESILPELAAVEFGESLGARYNDAKKVLTFATTSTIRLRYLETMIDASRRQGGQYQLLCFDERTLLPPGAAMQLTNERVRSREGSGVPVLGVRSTSNPGGPSHAEAKSRYIDATNHGERVAYDGQGNSIRFIPARVSDNQYVDAGYRARLESIEDPARRAAMLEGSWDTFAGQVFVEWRYDRHVVQPWLLPESWQRYAGIDWGYTAPWAALWGAVDEDERLWIYRELYETGVGEHEQARRIEAAEREGRSQGVDDDGSACIVQEPGVWHVGDPAMKAQRGDAEAITTAYADEGIFVEPANNDRLAGWQRVHTFLGDGPACAHHREQGWERCPRLHVFATCANLIRTLPALTYSQTRVEDVDTHAEDHAADALRYLCMAVGSEPAFHFAPERPPLAEMGVPLHAPLAPGIAIPLPDDDAPWLR